MDRNAMTPDPGERARQIVEEWARSTGQTVVKEWLWDEERNGLLKIIARALARVEAEAWEAAAEMASHVRFRPAGTAFPSTLVTALRAHAARSIR